MREDVIEARIVKVSDAMNYGKDTGQMWLTYTYYGDCEEQFKYGLSVRFEEKGEPFAFSGELARLMWEDRDSLVGVLMSMHCVYKHGRKGKKLFWDK